MLAQNDINSPADASSALFDKIPGWINSATASAEAAASSPTVMAVGTLCVAGLVTTTIGGPRVVRKAAIAARTDPSDLYIGDRDGGKLFGKLPVRLAWEDRCTGVRITGPPGSGKTTAAVPYAMDDLLAGRDVFVLESHGDLGTEIRKRAAALGVDILSADASEAAAMYWNPLAGQDTEDVANRVSAAISSSLHYHGFYTPMGETIVRNFVHLARDYTEKFLERDPSQANWKLLYDLIWDADFLHEVLQTKTEKDASGSKRMRVGNTWLSDGPRAWFNSEFFDLPSGERHRNMENIASLFDKLSKSRGAKHILYPDPEREELDLYGLLKEPSAAPNGLGRLIMVRAPVQVMDESPARTITYLVLKIMRDATLARAAPEHHTKPLSIFVDELPAIIGQAEEETQREVTTWLALVRDKNVAPHLIFQGHALLPKVMRDGLDATVRNFIVFGGSSADEVEHIRRSAGVAEMDVEDSRTSYSSSGKTYSEGKRKAEKKRLSFDEVKYRPRGEAVYLGVKKSGDQLPLIVKTRRAKPVEHYQKLREKVEAKEEAARVRAEERAAKQATKQAAKKRQTEMSR